MIFDHIGVFVASLPEGRRHLEAFLGVQQWTLPVEDPLQKVVVQFGTDGSGMRYEIVAPWGVGDPVTPVLKTGRNILNHVAYRVVNLEQALSAMRAAGGMPLGEPKPATAFDGRRIVFILTPLRLIVELIEDRGCM